MDRQQDYKSITTLDNLLPTLEQLDSRYNTLTHLGNIQPKYFNNNKRTYLDNLPPGLKQLGCYYNNINITHLDYFQQH
jgi:hypothetical protein